MSQCKKNMAVIADEASARKDHTYTASRFIISERSSASHLFIDQ